MSKNRNTFYFDHDYSARNDEKILEVRSVFGWEGYGIFWGIIESMCENGGSIKRVALGGLSVGLGLALEKLKKVVDFSVEINLFEENDGIISNKRVKDHLSKRQALSIAGSTGGRGKKKPPFSHPKATLKAGEERRGEESIEKEINKNVEHKNIISEPNKCLLVNNDLSVKNEAPTKPLQSPYEGATSNGNKEKWGVGEKDSFEKQQMKAALEENEKYYGQSLDDHEWNIAVVRSTNIDIQNVKLAITDFYKHINTTYEQHFSLAKWRTHCANWIKLNRNKGQLTIQPSGKTLKQVQ